MPMMTKSYSEMMRYETFEERLEYLRLNSSVGIATFGFDRYINQQFYATREWEHVRNHVISRDYGCDLAVPGYEIHLKILIHHINPMVPDDIINRETWILEPEFLITTTHNTHNIIHYGNRSLTPRVVTERRPNDTKLW